MKKVSWRTERWPIAKLIPADYNPRVISERERADLEASIRQFSEVEPVVINANGTIIGGHQRVSIYADLGRDEVDVRIPDRQLTDEEERALNIRLNKSGGDWDWSKLRDGFDADLLLGLGFSDEELRVNFGLSAAAESVLTEDRMEILQVFPPEAPRVRERFAIHFENFEAYEEVRAAVESGKVSAADLLQLARS